MLVWAFETTVVALGLSALILLAGRLFRLEPSARHALWLVVLVKLLTPPIVHWPWRYDAGPSRQPIFAVQAPNLPDLANSEIVLDHDLEDGAGLPTDLADSTDRDVLMAENVELIDSISSTHIVARPWWETVREWVDRVWDAELVSQAWLLGCLVIVGAQASRVVRFHRRVQCGRAAPPWLAEELASIAREMGVNCPPLKVIAGRGSPLIWCLWRPVLVVPAALVEALPARRWRDVFAHELAHLRRGDVWVSRCLLAATWLWWWNPLFWWVRGRLERDAELACDALAISLCRGERRSYAETLIDVCSLISSSPLDRLRAGPALGMGARADGRFFERRLTMILRGRATSEPGLLVKLGAGLLALAAVPPWPPATPLPPVEDAPRAERPLPPPTPVPPLPPELPEEADEPNTPEPRTAERPRFEGRFQEVPVQARREAERAVRDAVEARKAAEDRMHEAANRLREMQERSEARIRDVQARVEQQLLEAMARVDEAQARAKKAGADDKELGEVRERLEREVNESLRGELRRGHEELSIEMAQAMDELKRAQAEVAAAQSEPAHERRGREAGSRRVPATPRPAAAPVRVRTTAPRAEPPSGMVVQRRPSPEAIERMERRLDQLEEKFDAVMEELRALRREMGGRDASRF